MENNLPVQGEMYMIPKKYRIIENLHIVFWLIKDLCWCIVFKPLGIAMIFPTLCIAGYIVWQNRNVASELYHNLAVLFWIMANSFWMLSEFFHFDDKKVFGDYTGKNLALIPFIMGITCLFIYYVFVSAKERKPILISKNNLKDI
jgi:hypothetical protein